MFGGLEVAPLFRQSLILLLISHAFPSLCSVPLAALCKLSGKDIYKKASSRKGRLAEFECVFLERAHEGKDFICLSTSSGGCAANAARHTAADS